MKPEWITALATLAYAVFTGLIIWEMRKDRKSLHKPILVPQLKDANYPNWIVLTLKNVGKGHALKCVAFCEDAKRTKWKLKDNIPPIASNESRDVTFIEIQNTEYELAGGICMKIEYSDIFEKTYKNKICIDVRSLLSLSARHP